MDFLESSFDLESSGSDTPPTEAPPGLAKNVGIQYSTPFINKYEQGNPASSSSSLIKVLKANAAVRFIEAGNYDNHDLPTTLPSRKKSSRFSLRRSLRSVASYLVSKVEPSLQEKYITIEESPDNIALFLVHDLLSKSNQIGKEAEYIRTVIASYPLQRLVDVSAFSVFEKDFFPFKLLSSSNHHLEVSRSVTEGSIDDLDGSKLFSSHGDVGLRLVFKEQISTLSFIKDKFRQIEIQFVTSNERNIWLEYLEKIYELVLLESVRTGDDAQLSDADLKRIVEESSRLMQEKPPLAVIERHIDFFLSSGGREVIDQPKEIQIIDPNDVPCNGILRIELGDDLYETRRFAYKKSNKSLESGEELVLEYLVMYPTTVSQHMRMIPKHKVPISQLRVIVEEEHWGNTFFLEQSAGAADLHRKSLFGVCRNRLAKLQPTFDASHHDRNSDFDITETIELQTNSFPNRIKWLKWFESLLKKPVIYLSRIREEKEALEAIQSPLRRATSLYPEPMASNFAES